MGIFGWDLPPGVTSSMLPGNEPVGPCDVCGFDPEGWGEPSGCICPECPECGDVGSLECYEKHGLERNAAQIENRTRVDEEIKAAVEAENAYWEQYKDEMI